MTLNELLNKTIFTLPRSDGMYDPEMTEIIKTIAQNRKVVLFAFPPKCAGTFLRTAAVYALGGALVRGVHAQGGREAQLYLPTFLKYFLGGVCEGPMVSHVHMQARVGNCHFIEALSLNPVVMVRSIPDMLVSLSDMYGQEVDALDENVMCVVPQEYLYWDNARKADFLIDMVAPWYVSFFASWVAYAAQKPNTVLILHFAEVMNSPETVLERILRHSGLTQPAEKCREAIEYVWNRRSEFRYNKGIEGRGHAFFAASQHARLRRLIAQYPLLTQWQDELL